MKKILSITLGCILTSGVLAQTSEIKFGVKAGLNLAKTTLSGSSSNTQEKDGSKFLASFHFSGLVDIPISKSFSVQPGLNLSGKGGKSEYGSEDLGIKIEGTDNIMYLEIPVNAVFKTKAFYIGAGPYAAYAVSGKVKRETTTYLGGTSTTTKYEDDIEFGNDKDNDDLKPIDFGLNVLTGYQLSNGVNIGANYGLGLTNLRPEGDSTNKKANSVISLSIGYMF